MASPAAAPEEFTQQEAARQSLIAIIPQSVPEIGARLAVRSPDGSMAHGQGRGQDDGAADNEVQDEAQLISIPNQSRR
ncbi:hypothetical protein ACP70R_014327 [Stipagrostis hirtigluma subsp. patula]